MIRNLLTILVFFFGPAILMFVVRNLLLLLKARLLARDERQRQPQVIDITPVNESRAPAWFKVLAVMVGIVCAWLAWTYMQAGGEAARHYVPAHVDAQGRVIPGHWESVPTPPAKP